MPRLRSRAVAAALLFVALGPAPGAARQEVDPSAAERSAIAQVLDRWNVPGAAVAVRYGSVSWAHGFGTRETEGSDPVTADTRFAIGSTTKQFTAAAVMMLVEEGRLGVVDTLGSFFPDLAEPYRGVTIHQMLVHESGIPRDLKAAHSFVGPRLIDALASTPADFAPGTGWAYSNTAYILLGMVVERVSGRTLAAFLEERVFMPLGMDSTVYVLPDSPPIDRAVGYEGGTGPLRQVAFLPARFGAGSIVSTARDLARWEQAFTEDRVVGSETRERMWLGLRHDAGSTLRDGAGRPFTTGYGWWVIQDRDEVVVSHGGSLDGYLATLDYRPADDLAVVVLLNNEGASGALHEIVRIVVEARRGGG